MNPPKLKCCISLLFALGVLFHANGQRIRHPERIGASDLIKLDVPEFAELSRSFQIDERGFLHLPVLDKPLAAAGRTASELGNEISLELMAQHLFRHPTVIVALAESCVVSVVGSVVRPSTVRVPARGMPLSRVLKAVGGVRRRANPMILLLFPGGVTEAVDTRELDAHPELDVVVPAKTYVYVSSQADQSSTEIAPDVTKPEEIKPAKKTDAQAQDVTATRAPEGTSLFEKLALVLAILSAAWSFKVWWEKVQEDRLDVYQRRQEVYTRTLGFWTVLARHREEFDKDSERTLRFVEKMFERAYGDVLLVFEPDSNVPAQMRLIREDFNILLGCRRGDGFMSYQCRNQQMDAFKRIEMALAPLREGVNRVSFGGPLEGSAKVGQSTSLVTHAGEMA